MAQRFAVPRFKLAELYYLLTGGQLQHHRGVFSKQRVHSLCNTVQGERYWLNGGRRTTNNLSKSIQIKLQQKSEIQNCPVYVLQGVGGHVLRQGQVIDSSHNN